MTETALTINAPMVITNDQIAGLLCTAIEGGYHRYWGNVEVAYKPTQEEINDKEKYGDWAGYPQYLVSHRNFKLRVISEWWYEPELPKTTILKLSTLKKGLKVMSEKYPKHFKDFLIENCDAITGDVFLQCCVEGEVIYG